MLIFANFKFEIEFRAHMFKKNKKTWVYFQVAGIISNLYTSQSAK